MCVFVFSPGRRIQIDYAAESISLCDGGSTDVIDLLVTNHSAATVERLHLVYPHAIPAVDTHESGPPSFSDATSTFRLRDAKENELYVAPSADSELEVKELADRTEITVAMTNPGDIREKLSYKGCIRGEQRLVPYTVAKGEALDVREWEILSRLGWSVFTIEFELPIEPSQARWLRVRGRTGRLNLNQVPWTEWHLRLLARVSTHGFEVVGPEDVRHRMETFLLGAQLFKSDSAAGKELAGKHHTLHQKLMKEGLEAPGTETEVMDYRINVFPQRYRKCDEPVPTGDIRPCGSGFNFLRTRGGEVLGCYQWKAGRRHAWTADWKGCFVVRIQVHVVSTWVVLMPYLLSLAGLFLALIALVTRPDIREAIRFWLRTGG